MIHSLDKTIFEALNTAQMVSEISASPEQSAHAQYELFNLDAMTNEQIATVGRAFASELDRHGDVGDYQRSELANEMAMLMDKDVEKLATSDPGRMRELIVMLEASEDPYDAELIGVWVARIGSVDYEFARDTLLRLYKMDSDSCAMGIGVLKDRITPEQKADLDAHNPFR